MVSIGVAGQSATLADCEGIVELLSATILALTSQAQPHKKLSLGGWNN
jgi:hypothetical protein